MAADSKPSLLALRLPPPRLTRHHGRMADRDSIERAEGVDRPAIGTMVGTVALLAAAGAAWIWRRARRRPPPPA